MSLMRSPLISQLLICSDWFQLSMMCQWFRIVQHLCRDAFILVTKSGYKLSFVLLTLLTWILVVKMFDHCWIPEGHWIWRLFWLSFVLLTLLTCIVVLKMFDHGWILN
ncbi:hypothetical protein P8452_68430 [Trifolium repens]|nr:hypothetical protein P8452_68430 [Trifolium repens]